MNLACRACRTHPNGLVRSSAGLITPLMWCIDMSRLSIQSCMAKNLMSICRDLCVGFFEFTMSMVGLLSSYIGVGPSCLKPSSFNTARMNLAVLAAVTAAINSASVELSAVMDCAFDLYTIAPPEYVNAKPVVDRLFCFVISVSSIHKTD